MVTSLNGDRLERDVPDKDAYMRLLDGHFGISDKI